MIRANRFAGSLLGRLTGGYVLVAAVLSSVWLWSLFGPLTDATLNQQERNLTAVAQSAALLTAESRSTPREIAQRLVARTDLRLTIVGAQGDVVADSHSDPARMENHAGRPEIATALSGHIGTHRRVSRTERLEALYVAVPGSLNGERVAIRVAQPVAQIREMAARSQRVGIALLLVALVIAAVVAGRAARATTGPVRELSAAAQRMAAGDLSAEVPGMPSDLEPIANALADLRAQVRSRLLALETEKATLESTLDGLEDAVLVVEAGVIRFANDAADTLFRAPKDGWHGTSLNEADLPHSLAETLAGWERSKGARSVELEPDPTGRTFRVTLTPLGPPSATRRSIVVVSDVTERARLDRVRRDFVANASHELKTPASGIRLLAQSAEAAAADGDVETALAFTRQIEAETARLQHLVGDLLDLSRLESPPHDDAVAEVREAIDRAVLSHQAAATRKGLSLKVDATAVRCGDVFVRADATDLAIALDNLLDNAIAYTESGLVEISVYLREHDVEFRVTDTGPGIAPEHRQRVFERFYRIDRGRSRDAGGTGLGLALVRHVAERAGGSITLDSEPGAGSTFTLTLPRARWPANASGSPASAGSPARG